MKSQAHWTSCIWRPATVRSFIIAALLCSTLLHQPCTSSMHHLLIKPLTATEVQSLLACRQICAPFTLYLRHLQRKVGGLDTRLIVPDVDVAMTSRDFQALNDVINITGLAPVRPILPTSCICSLSSANALLPFSSVHEWPLVLGCPTYFLWKNVIL